MNILLAILLTLSASLCIASAITLTPFKGIEATLVEEEIAALEKLDAYDPASTDGLYSYEDDDDDSASDNNNNKAYHHMSFSDGQPRMRCASNASIVAQVGEFIRFARFKWPFADSKWSDAKIPSTRTLVNYICAQIQPGPYGPIRCRKLDLWLNLFIAYNYWVTEVGPNPYQVPPVWFNFLTEQSVYIVQPGVAGSLIYPGKTIIENQFLGLGKPLLQGGAGFFVNDLVFLNEYFIHSLTPGYDYTQSFVLKNLTSLDFSAPGTATGLNQYQLFTITAKQKPYPKTFLLRLNETIPLLKTVEWAGLCQFACINCPSGGTCPVPHAPSFLRPSVWTPGLPVASGFFNTENGQTILKTVPHFAASAQDPPVQTGDS